MPDALGGKLTLDITELKAGILEANRLIRSNESQWLSSAASMDDWAESEEGISSRMDTLSKNIELQRRNISSLLKIKEELIRQYGEDSKEVEAINKKIATNAKAVQRSQKEYGQLERQLASVQNETVDQSKVLDRNAVSTKKAEAATEKLDKSVRDMGDGFTIVKGAIATFIGNGLTALVRSVGNTITSIAGLTDSTRDYRTELAKVDNAAKTAGADTDYIRNKWTDLNSVISDDQAVTEGINNLLTAGYTTQEQLDSITASLEGAALQWKDTLKFEGLSDSLQEWIGSEGENLGGQFGELLERLGYNLDTVKEKTAGMSAEQRRSYAATLLASEGLSDISSAYRTANADLIDYNRSTLELQDAQASLGKMMQPLVTSVKTTAATILRSVSDVVTGVEGAGKELLYNIGHLVGMIYVSVTSALANILPLFQNMLPSLVSFITNYAPQFIAAGAGIIVSMLSGITASLPDVITSISGMLSGILLEVANAVPAMLTAAVDLLSAIVRAIPTVVGDIAANLPAIISAIIDGLFGGERSVLDSAIDLLGAIVDAIPPTIVALLKALPEIVTAVVSALADAVPKVWEAAKTLFYNIVGGLEDILPALGETALKIWPVIRDALTGIVDSVKSIGSDIIHGMIEGISSGWDALRDTVTGTAGKVLGWFKSALGIHSPSRIMRDEVGKYIAEGVAVGIKDGEYYVADSAEELADNAVTLITSEFEAAMLDAQAGIEAMAGSIGGGFGEGFMDAVNGQRKKMGDAVSGAVDSTGEDGKKAGEGVGKKIGDGIISGLQNIGQAIADMLVKALKSVADQTVTYVGDQLSQWTDVLTAQKDALRSQQEQIADIMAEDAETRQQIADMIGFVDEDVIQAALDKLDRDTAKKIDTVKKNTQSEVNDLVEGIDDGISLGSLLTGILSAVGLESNVATMIGNIFGLIQQFIEDPAGGMVMLEQIADKIVTALTDFMFSIIDNLPEILTMAIRFITRLGTGLIKAVPELIKNIPKIIKDIVKAFITEGVPAFLSMGWDLIKGMANGIVEACKNVWTWVKDAFNGMVKGIKKFFGIHSPSTLFRDEVGKNISLGIAEGITENMPAVNNALRRGVKTSVEVDGITNKQVTVNQVNNYSQAHSRYEIYKSKRATAAAVKEAIA